MPVTVHERPDAAAVCDPRAPVIARRLNAVAALLADCEDAVHDEVLDRLLTEVDPEGDLLILTDAPLPAMFLWPLAMLEPTPDGYLVRAVEPADDPLIAAAVGELGAPWPAGCPWALRP